MGYGIRDTSIWTIPTCRVLFEPTSPAIAERLVQRAAAAETERQGRRRGEVSERLVAEAAREILQVDDWFAGWFAVRHRKPRRIHMSMDAVPLGLTDTVSMLQTGSAGVLAGGP